MRNIFFIFLIFMAVKAHGQVLDLTYEEAVKIALEQNVDLKTQQNLMRIVKAEKNQSRGELAPSVSANLNGWRANGNTFVESEAKIINTTSDNLYGVLQASLNIFSGFSQLNTIKMANANYEAQHQLINRTSQDVVLIVTTQYLQALLDTELLEIAKDNLKTQEMLYRQIDGKVEAGNKPKSDLYDQLAIVKNRELLVLQAKNKLSNDKSLLAITLQLDPTIEMKLSTPEWSLEEIRLGEINLEELYEISMENRPDLKQFRHNESSAEKSISIAKASFAPSLYGYYNLSSRYNDNTISDLNQQFTVDNKRMEYGLALSIPIYTGLRNKTQFVRQKVLLDNSKINTENLKKTILNDVHNAYQNFMDVRTAYEVSLAQLEAAKMAFTVQQEKYSLGVGSLIELTNANNNYVLAASGKTQAQLTLLFQKVNLDYHTGVLQVP